MLRLTLAQMRRSLGRLVAAGVAIALGTAFVAITLVAGDVMTRTSYDAVTAGMGKADLVVMTEGSFQGVDLDPLRAVDGVRALDPLTFGYAQLEHGRRGTTEALVPTASDPRLATLEVVDGTAPTSDTQIALAPRTLERLGAGIGDTLEVTWPDPDTGDERSADVTVSGTVEDPAGAWSRLGGAGLAVPSAVATWSGVTDLADLWPSALLVAVEPGQQDAVAAELESLAPAGSSVLTRDQAAAQQVEEVAGGTNVVVGIVLGFAAIALLVAALVIANTFQVIVAQRTRMLALLRCVGARRSQVRRSVLTEAGVLGLTSSAVGLLAGTGLAQLALTVLGPRAEGYPLPPFVTVTPSTVLLTLLVGVAVTVLAALVPARQATRVSPVAALRPLGAPEVRSRAGKVRLWVSVVLVVCGALGLAGAVALALAADANGSGVLQLGVGLLAGATSFVGVLVGAVFWVPRVVAGVSRLLGRASASARIAAANTSRNPRRTATTSTALLIGVTLVVMMSTGAASARSSIDRMLDEQYPVDIVIRTMDEDGDSMLALADGLADVEGVAALVPVPSVVVDLDGTTFTTFVVSAQDAAAVVRAPEVHRALAAGDALLPASRAEGRDGEVVTLDALDEDWESTGRSVSLTARLGSGGSAFVTPSAAAELAPDAEVTDLFVSVAPGADELAVVGAVRDRLGAASVMFLSGATERVSYMQIVDVMLAIVVGLLGVAVVIALVGVANTLSLSVIERRRESATLRAIGLSRRGLRFMLAVEGMLIAGVGALLGAVLGVAYGWAGAATVFGQIGALDLAVPWLDLGIVAVVALLAGLAASVLPGRSAARTPPVAALGVD